MTAQQPADGGDTTAAVAAAPISPANCWGYSNDPHISTSSGTLGDIKGYAYSECDWYPDVLYIKASVWRDRWWGYQQMGEAPEATTTTARRIGRSGRWNGCDNNTWRTVGNHYSIEYGTKYSTETMQYKEIARC